MKENVGWGKTRARRYLWGTEMPFIRNGLVFAGRGGHVNNVSINGHVPPALADVAGGSAQLFQDTTVLFTGAAAGQPWGLYEYSLVNQQLQLLHAGAFDLVVAGRSVWAVHGATYRDSFGNVGKPWGVPTIAPDGDSLIAHADPQHHAPILHVRGKDLVDELTPAIANPGAMCVRDGVLLWRDGNTGRLRAIGAEDPVVAARDNYGCLFCTTREGRYLVIGYGDEGLFLQPWTNPSRALFITSELAFAPDVEVRADGRVRIVGASTSGEAPTLGLSLYELDLARLQRRTLNVVTQKYGEESGILVVDVSAAPPRHPPPQPQPIPEPQPMPNWPPQRLEVVQRIREQLQPRDEHGAFEVVKRVAWELRGEGAGLLLKPAGENVVNWRGQTFSAGRLCYPGGLVIKVITDVGPGGQNGAGWHEEDVVDATRYVPAMDPAGDAPPPIGPAPVPSPPTLQPVDLRRVLEELANVAAELKATRADVRDLRARLERIEGHTDFTDHEVRKIYARQEWPIRGRVTLGGSLPAGSADLAMQEPKK